MSLDEVIDQLLPGARSFFDALNLSKDEQAEASATAQMIAAFLSTCPYSQKSQEAGVALWLYVRTKLREREVKVSREL